MNDKSSIARFVDIDAMRRLARGLTIDVEQCADVLDHALVTLDEQMGLPQEMLDWIARGAFVSGPVRMMGSGALSSTLLRQKTRKGSVGSRDDMRYTRGIGHAQGLRRW